MKQRFNILPKLRVMAVFLLALCCLFFRGKVDIQSPIFNKSFSLSAFTGLWLFYSIILIFLHNFLTKIFDAPYMIKQFLKKIRSYKQDEYLLEVVLSKLLGGDNEVYPFLLSEKRTFQNIVTAMLARNSRDYANLENFAQKLLDKRSTKNIGKLLLVECYSAVNNNELALKNLVEVRENLVKKKYLKNLIQRKIFEEFFKLCKSGWLEKNILNELKETLSDTVEKIDKIPRSFTVCLEKCIGRLLGDSLTKEQIAICLCGAASKGKNMRLGTSSSKYSNWFYKTAYNLDKNNFEAAIQISLKESVKQSNKILMDLFVDTPSVKIIDAILQQNNASEAFNIFEKLKKIDIKDTEYNYCLAYFALQVELTKEALHYALIAENLLNSQKSKRIFIFRSLVEKAVVKSEGQSVSYINALERALKVCGEDVFVCKSCDYQWALPNYFCPKCGELKKLEWKVLEKNS